MSAKLHAKYSASGSKRWLECAGSIALSERAPEPEDSPYAKEGTQAHEVLEFIVKNRKNRSKAVVFLRNKNPESMIIHAEATLDYVEKRLKEFPGAELHIEIRCDLPVSMPGQFGTTDIAIIEHFGRLIVIDYKYGAGIPVPVEENSQLIYYALGIAHLYDYNFAEVELVVVQPRAEIDGKYTRTWLTDIDTLLAWRDKFEAGIGACEKARKKPEAHLRAGAHCQFCPAKVICPELKNKALREAQVALGADDEEPQFPAVTSRELPPERLGLTLTAIERLEKWIDGVREYAEGRLHKGVKIPGWTLIEKRGQRTWRDPKLVEKVFFKRYEEAIFTTPELLSPAQMEKLSPKAKKIVDKHTITVSCGVKLGPDPTYRVKTVRKLS